MDAVVLRWLQELLPPCDPQVHPNRKRSCPFADMDTNQATPKKRETKGKTMSQAESAHAPVASQLHILHETDDDVEQTTPRPSGSSSLSVWHNQDMREPRSSCSSLSSHATTNSQRSTTSSLGKRKRGESPVKGFARIEALEYPVSEATIGQVKDMPEALRTLTKTVKDMSKGRGIIDMESVDALRSIIVEDDEEDAWVVSAQRRDVGRMPKLDFVKRIAETTQENRRVGRSEAAWNCNVHYPLLHKARRLSPHSGQVRCENITTATVEHDETGKSRKADFAFTLCLAQHQVIQLARRGIETLSQTTYQPLCHSPPTVYFETKLDGEGGLDADLQLRTWAHAHITALRFNLRRVGRSSVPIPALPVVVVQGGKWHFNYYEVLPDRAVRWGEITVGDTATVRGVYEVFAALQHLIKWSEQEYRPWFETNILAPLLEQPI